MYIVFEHEDYGGSEAKSAHEDLAQAMEAAKAVVSARTDAWDVSTTHQDVTHATGMGPALRIVAHWRVYDLYDIVVCEVILSPVL